MGPTPPRPLPGLPRTQDARRQGPSRDALLAWRRLGPGRCPEASMAHRTLILGRADSTRGSAGDVPRPAPPSFTRKTVRATTLPPEGSSPVSPASAQGGSGAGDGGRAPVRRKFSDSPASVRSPSRDARVTNVPSHSAIEGQGALPERKQYALSSFQIFSRHFTRTTSPGLKQNSFCKPM